MQVDRDAARKALHQQKRQQYIGCVSRESSDSREARECLRQLALPRLMVVWFNAWECTSAQDTWARYASHDMNSVCLSTEVSYTPQIRPSTC